MRNKPNDVPYLGCDAEKIKTATPQLNYLNIKYLMHWVRERYKIHYLKDVMKKDPPWTEDPILRDFRFTNVRREQDKETKWVIDNICSIPTDTNVSGSMSWASKVCNHILFRMFNKSETCKNFLPINFDEGVEWKRIVSYFEDSNIKNNFLFSRAYKTIGLRSRCYRKFCRLFPQNCGENLLYQEISLVLFVKELYEDKAFITKIESCVTAQDVFTALQSVYGVGSLLAYQIFVDITYAEDSLWSENEFVVAGPGARKGLDYMFFDKDGMTYEECLFWLRDNWNDVCQWAEEYWDPDTILCDLPPEDRVMNVMSLENCMCEISKYIRIKDKIGKNWNRYYYKVVK